MAEFELRYFLDDLGCKLVIYINRVSRGVSLYTTCLLSCFQVITVSTSNTVWVKLTHRAIRYMSPSCALCWLTQLLLNSRITVRVSDLHSNRNATKRFSLGYCSGFVSGSIITPLYVFLLCLTDGLCLGLMAWASGSMVSILCRHKKRVQYIHSAHQSPRVSPEARATRFILILVSTFITFYSLSSTLVLYIVFFDDPNLWKAKLHLHYTIR
ncbi:vomeronasal type-1 receptor 4-like [Ctenodactylus gundi]